MSATDNSMYFHLGDCVVFVEEEVVYIWEKHRQVKAGDKESFGVLVGSRSSDDKTFWIECCTTPRLRDRATRTGFVMKDRFHQRFVEFSYRESEGLLGYIGTWHTHPEAAPSPSITDVRDWLTCMERNPDRKLFFTIIGTAQTRIFLPFEGKFLSMSEEEQSEK